MAGLAVCTGTAQSVSGYFFGHFHLRTCYIFNMC